MGPPDPGREVKSAHMKPGKPLARHTPIKARNLARLARLRASGFGTDGKREWIMGMPCIATGRRPTDPAHVLGTRGAGHGPEGLAPLARDVHTDFDGSMTNQRFAQRHGCTREWIRQQARRLEKEWQANQNDLAV